MTSALHELTRLSKARSRCISAENVYGEVGRGGMAEISLEPQPEVTRIGQLWNGLEWPHANARHLGPKWKVRPCIALAPCVETTLMDVNGPGCIRHIWFTLDPKWTRMIILRMYWDGEETPSVEVPIGDFFCNATKYESDVHALPINVNPSNGLNSFFAMPFAKHARITVENLHPDTNLSSLFYAINYTLEELPPDTAYFHASFRRTNPLPDREDFVIVDGIRGRGQFVGCYMTWKQNNEGWWGEGEVKMFLDGDDEYPTICGTGSEDYFGGAWAFGKTFTAPFMGYPYGGDSGAGKRHSMYRFHIPDPVHFEQDFRATIQALGCSEDGYFHLQDDISAVAYWYQAEPHAPFPALPDREALEVL